MVDVDVCLFFKDTEPSTSVKLRDSSSVRQQGGLPGPSTRSPLSRIHRRPGGLPLPALRPESFRGLGVLPGPATCWSRYFTVTETSL